MAQRQAQVVVAPEEAGYRLDGWLAERFTYHSRSEWQRMIRQGRLTINGDTVKPARFVQAGDLVEYLVQDAPEPPVDFAWSLVAEDDTLAVVSKSGDLPCHPGGRYFRHTLWHELQRRWPDCHLVNRLDRETSGIVLVAFSARAAAALQEQFAAHTVRKEYVALVEGEFPDELEAAGRLLPDAASPVNKKRRFEAGLDGEGETAITHFACVARRDGMSLVRCLPATGRLHQLRATLRSLGYPLVGDKLYGVDDRLFLAFIDDGLTHDDLRRLRMTRQALHAGSLTFRHPATGAETTVQAPLPSDFAACLLTHGFPEPYSSASARAGANSR